MSEIRKLNLVWICFQAVVTTLTVETAVSCIFCQTAAHRLVPLSDVTRSSVQTVVVTNPPLTEGP